MDFDPFTWFGFPADGTLDQNKFTGFNYHHAPEPSTDNFDFGSGFSNPQWDPVGDIFPLIYSPLPQPSFDNSFPLLSPPATTPEQSATPSFPHPPSPEPPLVGSSVGQLVSGPPSPDPRLTGPPVTQPPVDVQPIPLPTPQAPVQQLTPRQIKSFYFCPYTENGRICGLVNWGVSSNKAIHRHMKREHFTPGSDAMAWKCPNPKCQSRGRSFERKDTLRAHRKHCNSRHLRQDPDFIPPPDIEEGNDGDVKRWMKAGSDQRRVIREKLRAGTPWSVDLLQPVHL